MHSGFKLLYPQIFRSPIRYPHTGKKANRRWTAQAVAYLGVNVSLVPKGFYGNFRHFAYQMTTQEEINTEYRFFFFSVCETNCGFVRKWKDCAWHRGCLPICVLKIFTFQKGGKLGVKLSQTLTFFNFYEGAGTNFCFTTYTRLLGRHTTLKWNETPISASLPQYCSQVYPL